MCALNSRGLFQLLAIAGTHRKISQNSARYHFAIIRTCILRLPDRNVIWNDGISAADINPLFLSMILLYMNGTGPRNDAFKRVVTNGHFSTLRWMIATFRGPGIADALIAALESAQRSVVDDILFHYPMSLVLAGVNSIHHMLKSNDVGFIIWAFDKIRPNVEMHHVQSAIGDNCSLPIIQFLYQQAPQHFTPRTALEHLIYYRRRDVIEWLRETRPEWCTSHATKENLRTAIQSAWMDVPTLEWLIAERYASSHVLETIVEPRDLAVVQYLHQRGFRISDQVILADFRKALPFLPWLREQESLTDIVSAVINVGLQTFEVTMLTELKNAGFVLRGVILGSWYLEAAYQDDFDQSLDFLEALHEEGVTFENPHSVAFFFMTPASMKSLQWLHDHFPFECNVHDFHDALQDGFDVCVLEWIHNHGTIGSNGAFLSLTMCTDALVWLLEHRDDPVDMRAVENAVRLRSLKALQLMHAKLSVESWDLCILFRAATRAGSVPVVRWFLQTFPMRALERRPGHLTMKDIVDGYTVSGSDAVSMYLERSCEHLFPAQVANKTDAERTIEADQLFDTYQLGLTNLIAKRKRA